MIRQTLFALGLSALAVPAAAEVYPNDVQSIMRVFQSEGYLVSQSLDSVGDPMLDGKIDGTPYRVLFYGCGDTHDACTTIQFKAGYDLTSGMSLVRANAWNRDKRFGKVYLDDEMDPFIEYNLNLYGGVTDANFADTIDWWRVVMGEFEDYIGW